MLVLGAILALFLGVGIYVIAVGPPLIFDEAVYALRARDFLLGVPPSSGYWMEVRAPGLPLLLTPLSAVGRSDELLRSASLLVAAAGVGLTWWEGRLLFGRSAALVAAALVALSPGWNLSGWQVLPDIPGATLTLACVVLLTSATQGDKVRWWALVVPLVAALATMVRFGAPLLLGPALLMVAIVRWRVVLRSWLFTAAVGLATAAAVSVVWLVPAVTGKETPPLLIFLGRQTNKDVGLVDRLGAFVEEIPILLGVVVGIAILVGLIAACVGASKGQVPISPVLGCAAVGVIALVALTLGIADHEVRYFTPAVPFLALGAAPGLVWLGSRLPRPVVVVTGGLTLLLGLTITVLMVREYRILNDVAETRRRAAVELATMATQPCVIVSRNPSNGWYSGCDTVMFPVERRWVNGEPTAGGIADRKRMLSMIRRSMGAFADGADPEIYLVASAPPMSQEPTGAARQLLMDLVLDETVSVRDADTTVRVFDLGSASRVLAEVTSSP